jgi:hypothetical protein
VSAVAQARKNVEARRAAAAEAEVRREAERIEAQEVARRAAAETEARRKAAADAVEASLFADDAPRLKLTFGPLRVSFAIAVADSVEVQTVATAMKLAVDALARCHQTAVGNVRGAALNGVPARQLDFKKLAAHVADQVRHARRLNCVTVEVDGEEIK